MRKSGLLKITVVFLMAVCTISEQQAQHIEEKAPLAKKYIAIVGKGLKGTYWKAVKSGAQKAAEDYNVQIAFEGPQMENSNEQLEILQAVLSKAPNVVVLSAVDSKAVTPYLEKAQAQAQGIPVIGFDSGVDSPIVKTTVATDNYGAGALAADKMAELVGEEGEIELIMIDDQSKVSIDRRDGLVDTINQNYPKMKIVDIKYTKGNPEIAVVAAKEMIKAYPNIKGIFGGYQGATEGIIQAVKELDKVGQIKVVGFDSGDIVTEAIRNGIVAGAVSQNPRGMGYMAVEAALKAAEGENLPEFIDTGFAWYDKSNIDSPEIKKLLY